MLSEKMRPRRRMMAEINVVPYIDVMLVLLIVFMVAAPLMSSGIALQLPDAEGESIENDEEPIILSVDPAGLYYINLGESKKPQSLASLSEMVSQVRLERPNVPIFLEGDEQAPYGYVAGLLGHMQSIGVVDVALVTDPSSSSPDKAVKE